MPFHACWHFSSAHHVSPQFWVAFVILLQQGLLSLPMQLWDSHLSQYLFPVVQVPIRAVSIPKNMWIGLSWKLIQNWFFIETNLFFFTIPWQKMAKKIDYWFPVGQFNWHKKSRASFRAKTRSSSAKGERQAATCRSAIFQFDILGQFRATFRANFRAKIYVNRIDPLKSESTQPALFLYAHFWPSVKWVLFETQNAPKKEIIKGFLSI